MANLPHNISRKSPALLPARPARTDQNGAFLP